MTKGYSVINIISQLWVVFPFFNMMSLQLGSATAFLTGITISLKDIPAPLLVFIGASTLVLILDSLACVSAFLTTVFYFKVSIFGVKLAPAKMTNQLFSCSFVASPIFNRAFRGAGFVVTAGAPAKRFTTNNAYRIFAIFAVLAFGVIYGEIFSARFTLSNHRISWILIKRGVFPTKLVPVSYSFVTTRMRTLFKGWHLTSKIKLPRRLGAVVEAATQKTFGGVGRIITYISLNKKRARLGITASTRDIIAQVSYIRNLQRWADLTGLTPTLVSG